MERVIFQDEGERLILIESESICHDGIVDKHYHIQGQRELNGKWLDYGRFETIGLMTEYILRTLGI